MPMVLVPIAGGRPIPLDKAIIYFGRAPGCDVVLANSRKVSRKHCCVAQIDNYFVVRDLGSMNGLRVNDQQVQKESRLKIGDELWVGDVGYLLQAFSAEQAKNLKSIQKSKQKQKPVMIDPKYLSMDIPVAIPDESREFLVEESMHQKSIPDDEIIELNDDDILDD